MDFTIIKRGRKRLAKKKITNENKEKSTGKFE